MLECLLGTGVIFYNTFIIFDRDFHIRNTYPIIDYLHQAWKILLMSVDLYMLSTFCNLFRKFYRAKLAILREKILEDYRLDSRMTDGRPKDLKRSGLTCFNKAMVLWTVILVLINFTYIVYKCFSRLLRAGLDPDSVDVFDYVYQYRFVVSSIFEISNAISMLLCIYFTV